MTANPLVAGPVDTTTPFSGAGLLDSGTQLASAIQSGSWVDEALGGVGVAMDVVATASDPLGSLIAAGLGWLIDHLQPIKGWFDDLTGDPGEVTGFAATWGNVSTALGTSGDDLDRVVADLDDLHGDTFDAYRRFQTDTGKHLKGSAEWASAMSTGLTFASQIVQVVHDTVRDVLSQLVGSAISWAAEEVFSLGLATPWVVEQVSTRVASWVEKIGGRIAGLLRSCKTLAGLLDKLKALLKDADDLFRGVLRRDGGSEPVTTTATATKPVRWGGDSGRVDIDSVLDTPVPTPRTGSVDPASIDFDIPPDSHVFWSGRTPITSHGETSTYGSGGIAAGLARQNGGTTLESYLVDNDIAMPRWDGSPGAEAAWGDVSSRFAQSASGEVHVVLGSELRPGNVWETRELGALQSNPGVTRIVAVDPSTGLLRVVWER